MKREWGGAESMYPDYIEKMETMEVSDAAPDPADVRGTP